jgi:dephospho-CoA kinase
MMFRVGVTGLMASGKSSVARRLEEHGARLVDADALGWDVLRRAEIRDQLRRLFGDAIMSPDGAVDRGSLGRIVFQNPGSMERLNAVVQPVLVRDVREALAERPGDGVVVLDAALLSLWRLEPELDAVVEVSAPIEARIERLRASKGFTDAEARVRIEGQKLPPVRDATRRWRIENAGTRSELMASADRIWDEIRSLAPRGEAG